MNILDPDFKYVSAAKTDIRKTIRREQKRIAAQQAAEEEAQKIADAEVERKVKPLIKAKS